MKRHSLLSLSAMILAGLFAGHAAPAHAGDLSNAQLACYVDTYAYDQTAVEYCVSAWTPSTATNPSTAYFEVVGLPAGSYTYAWTNLDTGQAGVCSSGNVWCTRSIRVNRTASMSVTITDTATGATKTVMATAEFIDGWN